ncbi:MAG: hypothetical protein NDI60_00965 [Elusimicrobiales bacterium]|nr:hypothetical protein [Elusimicrobiales bacterium]
MTDIYYLLEMLLILAAPFVPIAAGVLLRRKFPASVEPVPTAHKLGRLAGTLLVWGGAASVLFMIIVALNFKGIL